MRKEKAINWLVFVVLALIWGSSFILMKLSKEHLNGYQIGAVRIFSAGLVFLPFAVVHITKIPWRKVLLVALSGLLGNLLPAFLFAIAIEKKIDSALAGILNSLTPLFVIVIAVLFFKAKVQQRKVMGVIIGFIGLVILSLSKGGVSFDNYVYALLILLATIMYGLNVNVVTHYLKDVDPIKMATVSLAIMCLLSLGVMWQQEVFSIARYDEAARLSLFYAALLGVVGSALATMLFYALIKRAGGLFASMVTYAIPIVAIFWGVLAGEQVTGIQISCLALILGGVYLANKA
ncbi:MAG TPA: DMT family transporter [Chitinophagaceae bacterium]